MKIKTIQKQIFTDVIIKPHNGSKLKQMGEVAPLAIFYFPINEKPPFFFPLTEIPKQNWGPALIEIKENVEKLAGLPIVGLSLIAEARQRSCMDWSEKVVLEEYMKQHGTMEGYKNIEDILVNISGAEDDGETTLSFYVSKIKHDTIEPFKFITMNDVNIYPLKSGFLEIPSS